MKKQNPSCEFKTSHKRTSSTNNANLLLDNQPPPAKRNKTVRVDDCVTTEPVVCTSIHILPDEILDKVFSYLSIKQRIEIEKVCKRWNWMGQQLKWQCLNSLSIRIKRPLLTTSAIEAVLFRCGKRLRKLQLLKGSNSDDIGSCKLENAMEIIAQHCPNLEYMNIGALKLPNLCLENIAEGCPKLKTVCLDSSISYTESALTDFLELCKNLECLDISLPITGKCFSLVSSKLQILRLRSPKLKTVGLENVMNRCQHLRELRMSKCFVSNLMLKTFLMKYKKTLTTLVLRLWSCIDFCPALQCLQNLEALALLSCYRVDDEVMNLLAKECRNLVDLGICNSQVTDLGLRHLASLPHLKVLDISDNSCLSGIGVTRIARKGRLEELHAENVSAQPDCFIELARFCPNLHVVDMSYNVEISNFVIEAFCEGLKSGCLKGPLELFVGNTGVSVSTVQCDLLKLHFHLCCYRIYNSLSNTCYSVDI